MIAGPKFFRSFNKSTLAYIVIGIVVIAVGAGTAILFTVLDKNMSSSMAVGLLTGGLTSTPGFSAGKECAQAIEADVTAGYGIAYTFGVLGVVLFVQLIPKILKVNMQDEVHRFVISYHRSLRKKAMTRSILEEVEGLGPVGRKKLYNKFGSLKNIKEATLESLQTVVSEKVAQNIQELLNIDWKNVNEKD